MNSRYAPLAEVNKNSGAQRKNFKEDRPISLVGKCRPADLCSKKYKVDADVRGNFIREGRNVGY